MDSALLDTAVPMTMDAILDESAGTTPTTPSTATTATPTAVPRSGEVVTAAPVAQPAPAATSTVDSDRVAALEAKIVALTERLSMTPVPAQIDQSQIAGVLIAAENARRADWERRQAANAELRPPSFNEDQKSALVSDPDAQLAAMEAWARHGARVALAQVMSQVGPALHRAEIAAELIGPNSEMAADHAFNKARDIANSTGMSAEDFDAVGQTTYDYLWQASQQSTNPNLHFAKLTLNPQALATAARMAQAQRPVVPSTPKPVVEKPAPAPTVGAGTHRSDGGTRNVPANINLEYAESKLGRKLSPADIKRLNSLTKEYVSLGR